MLFKFNTPINCKRSVVFILTDHVLRLVCSKNLPRNIKIIKNVLKVNNYLPTFYNHFDEIYHPKNKKKTESVDDKTWLYLSVSFLMDHTVYTDYDSLSFNWLFVSKFE